MRPFVFKFEVNKNKFIYDVFTNNILLVDNNIYDIIDKVDLDKNKEQIYNDPVIDEIIKNRNEKNVFKENLLNEILFYDLKQIKHELNTKLPSITLNITQDCNLRCKYCIYSGDYKYYRTHSNLKMKKKTAFTAIDFLFNHSQKNKVIAINFYGGEPLIEWDLIVDSVEYTKEKNKNHNKDIIFTISTNSLLLNEEKLEYIIKNKIGLQISLDGPKYIHNRYRLTKNKKGTFNIVINNIRKIIKINKEYFSNYCNINMVISPPFDLISIIEFVKKNCDIFSLKIPTLNFVNQRETLFFKKNNINLKSEISKLEKQRETLFVLYKKHYKGENVGKLNKRSETIYLFLKELLGKELELIENRSCKIIDNKKFFLKRTCIPGIGALSIDIKGNLYLCNNIDYGLSIGSIYNGFNFDKIMEIIDNFLSLNRDCLNCWALRLCQYCFYSFLKGERFDKVIKKEMCYFFKRDLEKAFEWYIELNEDDFVYLL